MKLKNKKAPGIEGIPAEFLKAAEKELIEPLTLLSNYIMQAGKYPSVCCKGMINPLHKKGCTLDYLIQVIRSMYENSKCRVKVDGMLSKEIKSLFGGLQGGMISPKLFTEYLHDLQIYLQPKFGIVLDENIVQYILYADDLVLCSDTSEGLQEQIDGLYMFCCKWHMIVSPSKTKVLIFNQKINDWRVFKEVDNHIEVVNEYKYLGFIFNTYLKDPLGTVSDHLQQAKKKQLTKLES